MTTVAVARAGFETDKVISACRRVIDLAGGLSGSVRGQKVLIKPNLVAPVPPAVTSPAVISAVVQASLDAGAIPVIGECPGFEYDSSATLDILALRQLADRLQVEWLNLEEDDYIEVPFDHPRVKRVRVAKAAVECGAIINVPKMKRHKLTDVSLSIKNCFGMLEKSSRREVHAKGLDSGIAALYKLFRPAMTVMDGVIVPTSGAVYGDYVHFGAVTASTDMLALDAVAARLLGFPPSAIAHLALASASGIPSVELVGDSIEPVSLPKNGSARRHSIYRRIYAFVYGFDHYLSKTGAKTIIPWFHLKFGIRPTVDWSGCDACGECAAICPVDAFDVEHKRLDYGRCGKVRCLLCVDACPRGVVSVKQTFKF